jgi:4-amino-4-deoxy-L-arabinose transferase-like glycosyltransferase
MPVAVPETPKIPGSPPEAAAYRNLYILLLVCGFALRFGFVLWKKTYLRAPGSILPFGSEICSIAEHIVRGQGFSSPFFRDTGPTAWIAPVYPYLCALVFRIFGNFSVASSLVLLGIQCIIAGATGITIHALGRRTLGAQVGFCAAWIWTLSPFFFRWPVSWIWDFTASAFLLSAAFIVTIDVAEKNTRKLWLSLGGLWAVIALTNPALLSVMPFAFLYAASVNHRYFRLWMGSAALAGVLFTALVSPWLIRNERVFGQPVFFRSNYWFEFHLGNYHFSNGMGFTGRHPGVNPAELEKYAAWGELRYIHYYQQDSFAFVRKYPSEFADLTLHRALWFWDGSRLIYWTREWWKPWEFWPLSVLGWLGLLFVFTRRPRGWPLFAAALVVYPVPYYLAYPVVKYRHAIEPELLLLSVYLAFVLWGEIQVLVRRQTRLSARRASGASLRATATA